MHSIEIPLFEARAIGAAQQNGLALLRDALRARLAPGLDWQIAHAPAGTLAATWQRCDNDPATMAELAAAASPASAARLANVVLRAAADDFTGRDRGVLRRAAAAAGRSDAAAVRQAGPGAPYAPLLAAAADVLAERPVRRADAARALVELIGRPTRVRALLARRLPPPTLADLLAIDWRARVPTPAAPAAPAPARRPIGEPGKVYMPVGYGVRYGESRHASLGGQSDYGLAPRRNPRRQR